MPEILTPREKHILILMANGNSNAEIADRFSITVRGLDGQLRLIYRKLGVSNGKAAIAQAFRIGLLKPENIQPTPIQLNGYPTVLQARELQIAGLLPTMGREQIANSLGISPDAVRKALFAMRKKLRVETDHQIIETLQQLSLLSLPG